MYHQVLIDNMVREDLKRCQALYDDLKKIGESLPKGSLISRNGHTYGAYIKNGKQHKKVLKDEVLINKLKMHRFIKKALPLLEKRILACNAFLSKSAFYDPVGIIQQLSDVYKDLNIDGMFLKGDVNPNLFKQENYERNSYPFATEHWTEGGIRVRSKAEAMIGTQLEHKNWLFICEPCLHFGSEVKSPDFAILHPVSRKIIYLEHFGKMGDDEYVADTLNKLVLYRKHGLILGVNFFFTWESQAKPLTYREINSVLDEIEAAGWK